MGFEPMTPCVTGKYANRYTNGPLVAERGIEPLTLWL